MSSPQAFDALAPSYDTDFTSSPIARYLREQVHDRLLQHFRAGDHVLELGCGTGEDARFLAQQGVRVTATDSSEAMLAAARAKLAGNPLVHIAHLDMKKLPASSFRLPATNHYAGAFANFGAVNCLNEWRTLAAWLSERIRPGGIVGLGVMSLWCLWEPLWHGLHGNLATATRRWKRQGATFNTNGSPITIHYPTIRRLQRDFSEWFTCTAVRPLGVFLPPSDVYGAIEKRPRLLGILMGLEQHFGHWTVLAPFADHYWIEFKRK
ncbi:MAG TPA: class I SAM-dependent methyltransferase [Aggregatilineales bacterium]|nr:class I SAM-dependent methyltransferase [Aggregatilineales bacterium]